MFYFLQDVSLGFASWQFCFYGGQYLPWIHRKQKKVLFFNVQLNKYLQRPSLMVCSSSFVRDLTLKYYFYFLMFAFNLFQIRFISILFYKILSSKPHDIQRLHFYGSNTQTKKEKNRSGSQFFFVYVCLLTKLSTFLNVFLFTL